MFDRDIGSPVTRLTTVAGYVRAVFKKGRQGAPDVSVRFVYQLFLVAARQSLKVLLGRIMADIFPISA
jgi:hypothetical protein